MPFRAQILVAEDSPYDAELLAQELGRSGLQFDWKRVDTEADYLAALDGKVDLIISDYVMPQFSGARALELLKQIPDADIPFIVVSGTIGEEKAAEVIKDGAADYILKDRLMRIGPAVKRCLQDVEDRAARKRLEVQFIEAQKMEVVGQLAGGVAHDFNNVLAVIMGYSDLMTQELPPGNPLLKYLQEINDAAHRAAGLTQQLLIFSRKQTVQAEPLDPNEVLENTSKMLRRLLGESIEMTVREGEDVKMIKAYPGYIWQVLMNLVINARDAMPNGGKLTITTDVVELPDSHDVPDAAAGDYVRFCVADTGLGMPEEIRARIFDPFFTTKPVGKGTGLGLATCRNIMKQSGGFIKVESEVGKGTTFELFFPQLDIQAVPAQAKTKTVPLRRRGTETLLVVEDEPSVRHLAQGVLEAQGYKVLTSPNGQDALRVAREHTGSPIALVISDVVMPRMGGKVMAEWLKTIYPDLKVLFTSGYTEDAIAHHGVLEKGVEFLPKPYTPSGLAKKVRAILDA